MGKRQSAVKPIYLFSPHKTMPNSIAFSDHIKILVLDEEPTWTEAYIRWMGGSPLPSVPKWKVVPLSELKKCLQKIR